MLAQCHVLHAVQWLCAVSPRLRYHALTTANLVQLVLVLVLPDDARVASPLLHFRCPFRHRIAGVVVRPTVSLKQEGSPYLLVE